MRNILILASTTMLAACGGATGAQSAGSVAVATSGSQTSTASFVAPADTKTYTGIGVVEHYEYYTNSNGTRQGGQLYAGDAGTARDGGISVTYNPRDAIFELTIDRPKGIVSVNARRFQDPAHRTAFGGLAGPQAGVPNLSSAKQIQYLEAGTSTGQLLSPTSPYYSAQSQFTQGDNGYSSTRETFFYQKPGTTTNYVTYAGYVRTTLSAATQTNTDNSTYLRQSYSIDHAAFVYGERTANNAVPITGTGTYSGDMIATMVFNSRIDTDPAASTYFQWLDGSNTTTVNFATKAVTTTLTGTVMAPTLDSYTNGVIDIPAGSTFSASATGTVDLVNKGGFSGTFGSAVFTRPDATPTTPATTAAVNIAGSSLDGAFFGPNGEEVGGAFRIVGGTPDQRIDILGTFTGKK